MRRGQDAYDLRQELARELADWKAGQWITGNQAWRFHCQVRRLARISGLPRDVVYQDLQEDATAILLESDHD